MPKCETRAGARASRNSCGGRFRDNSSAHAIQAQFLIVAHHVRPELAAMLASMAFGGGAHG